MAVTRTIHALIQMACCRGGTIIYFPKSRPIRSSQTKSSFRESLEEWERKATNLIYDKYEAIAHDECYGMGGSSVDSCSFSVTNVSSEETGAPTKECTESMREALRLFERNLKRAIEAGNTTQAANLERRIQEIKKEYNC